MLKNSLLNIKTISCFVFLKGGSLGGWRFLFYLGDGKKNDMGIGIGTGIALCAFFSLPLKGSHIVGYGKLVGCYLFTYYKKSNE